MGGGDLNSKKSWHPNTMKNQEMVWKAEQKLAQEKKMIAELQRERAQERDRAELNEMARRNTTASTTDDRLSWMYDKPDKTVQQEDYLLGKAVDGNFDRSEKAEQDAIPAVSRRVVVGAGGAGDSQVDLVRKLREDPLLLIKERERAARAALLQNPIQRKKLTELLRKEQEHSKEKKEKKSKKKDNDLDGILAAKLNALSGEKGINLAALLESGNSSSSESSDDDKPKKKKNKKDRKKSKKSKSKKQEMSDSDDSADKNKHSKRKDKVSQIERNKRNSSDQSSDEEKNVKLKSKGNNSNRYDVGSLRYEREQQDRPRTDRSPQETQRYWRETGKGSPRRRGDSPDTNRESRREKKSPKRYYDNYEKTRSPERDRRSPKRKRSPIERDRSPGRNRARSPARDTRSPRRARHSPIKRDRSPRRDKSSPKRKRNSPAIPRRSPDRKKVVKGISEEEKAARLAEMANAGATHERERGERVARQRAAIAKEEASGGAGAAAGRGGEARALPASLSARLHSNRHNIQRGERHMDNHFAKR